MSHKVIKLFLVFLCMSLEVHVKAKALLTQQPTNCLKSSAECAISVSQENKKYLPLKMISIVASRGSVFIRNKQGEFDFIKGKFQVFSHKQTQLQTEFGNIILNKNSSVILEKTQKSVLIYPLSHGVSLKKLEVKEAMSIPVGLSYMVGRIGVQGLSESSLPQMVDIESLIPLWDSLDIRKKKQFKEAVRTYYSQRKITLKSYEKAYETEVKREVASYKKKRAYEKQQQGLMRKENDQLTKLFRKRYFLDR